MHVSLSATASPTASGPPHLAQRSRRASSSSVRPIEIPGSQLIGLSPDPAASRAAALDVLIALGSEVLESGVERIIHY